MTNLTPDVNPMVIASLSGLLARDFQNAASDQDLATRLSKKGYQLKGRYLATAPHGKLICRLAQLGVR